MFIMRGLPGSGKSTIARQLALRHSEQWFHNLSDLICATDDYWLRPDGIYDFNPSMLGFAHTWNINRSYKLAEDWTAPVIVIDNTNMQLSHIKPYLDMAKHFAMDTKFIVPGTPWAWDVNECALRNTHGVPKEVIQRMKDRYEPHADDYIFPYSDLT